MELPNYYDSVYIYIYIHHKWHSYSFIKTVLYKTWLYKIFAVFQATELQDSKAELFLLSVNSDNKMTGSNITLFYFYRRGAAWS